MTAEEFVQKAAFTFARTMPDQPHEYAVKGRDPDISEDEFHWMVAHILDNGYRAKYDGRWYVYLEIGDWKYWSMTGRVPYTTIINRARIDGANVAPGARPASRRGPARERKPS